MGRFQITLVRPQGYLHPDAYQTVAEMLQFGLRSLGHSADIQENLFAPGASNIFLGVHLLSPQQAVIIPPGSVVYNLEPLDDPNLPPHYCDLARQYVLWDYSLQNLEKWKTIPCVYAPIHVPLPSVLASSGTLNWAESEAQRQETEILRRALQESEGPIAVEVNCLAQPNRMAAAAGSAVAQPPSSPTPIGRQTTQLEPHITHISRTSASPLVVSLQAAFNLALAGGSGLNPAVLEMDGMSGKRYRMLINNLIHGLHDPRYLEIGTWAGSTLCSAINNNSVRATAIDNWSEFGGPKAQFLSNLERFQTPKAKVSFLETDFRSVDYTQLGRFNAYMFDGPHTAADQFDGIALVQPALDDEFILIVDDWNHTPAREGTLQALHKLNLSIVHCYEIRTTLDGSHPTVARQASDWHNGYLIAVVAKADSNTLGNRP
jgi:Methyltransferase domain